MKPYLAIITILAGVLLISVEFFAETHIILTVVGGFLGLCLIIEGILDLRHIQHGYILRWKSFWMGIEMPDKTHEKTYLNLLPGVTLWWKSPDKIL